MKLNSNISKLYASYFLNGIVFFYGIEKIFYESIGIDEVGIGVITVVYLVTALLFDIPSGVLADKWSRKGVLIVSALMLIISSVILGFSENLLHYSIGAAVWGGYFILLSGTFEAITYDSLHELKRSNEFSKVLGRENALFLIGIVISSAVSGFIAEASSLQAAYFLSVIPAVINIGVLISLKEPKFHEEIVDQKLLDHVKTSWRYLFSTALMRRITFVLAAVVLLETHADEYGQVAFIALGYSAAMVGILGAIYAGAGALGQLAAHLLNDIRAWLLPLMSVGLLIFAFNETEWALGAFFFAIFVRSILENLNETDIQDSIDSSVRATTLSVFGFIANLISIPLIMIFGYIALEHGVYTAFQGLAVAYAVISILVLMSRLRSSSRAVRT